MAYFSNDPGVAITCSQEAMALMPEAWMFVRSGGMLFQTLTMQVSGQGQAALKLLIENYESLGDRASAYARRLMQALCLIYYAEADDLEHVIQTAQQMVVGVEGGKVSLLLQAWGQYFIGMAHYQRNDLVAARQCFTRLLDFKYTGNIGALRDGMQRLALIHQIAGDQAESSAILQLLDQLDLDQMGRETDETGALRARVRLMRGELENPALWADGFTAPVPNQPWPWQDPPHLIKARILWPGRGCRLRSALEILDAFYEAAERGHNNRLKIEVLALRALALDAAGKAGEAMDTLRAAVDLAQHGGFLRPFLDLGPAW